MICRSHVGAGAEPFDPLPANPLLNPPAKGTQGESSWPWVTEWELKIDCKRKSSKSNRDALSSKDKSHNVPQLRANRRRVKETPFYADLDLGTNSPH